MTRLESHSVGGQRAQTYKENILFPAFPEVQHVEPVQFSFTKEVQESRVVILMLLKGAITPYWMIAAGVTDPRVFGKPGKKARDISSQRHRKIHLDEIQRDWELSKHVVRYGSAS